MFLEQFYLGCLSQASYLVGDESAGVAAVVDPRRDVDIYLEAAAARGVRITHAILTHLHADFIAGHIELQRRAGARIAIGAAADVEFERIALRDGDTLDLGQARLRFLETPGHTPESVSIVIFDLAASADVPHAVLTGDTLFIGDVGRPDLMASVGVTAEELASSLYDSLHQKLDRLPDSCLVYPGHGAGSLCGRSLGSETVSTMGEQRRYNYALKEMSRERFIELVTADQPAAPGYFSYDAQINRRARQTLEEALSSSLRGLGVDDILQLQAQGAQLLDTRDAGFFAAAHLRGSINIGLDGQYASWAGTLLDRSRPIAIIAEPGSEEEATIRLGRIGFDGVAGYLERGMGALAKKDELVERFDRYAPATLVERLAEPDPPLVLDVRTEPEHAAGSVPGAVNIPLAELPSRMSELPRDRGIVVHCASGYRSATAVSLLSLNGFAGVSDVAGGYEAWEAVTGGERVGPR